MVDLPRNKSSWSKPYLEKKVCEARRRIARRDKVDSTVQNNKVGAFYTIGQRLISARPYCFILLSSRPLFYFRPLKWFVLLKTSTSASKRITKVGHLKDGII